MLKKYNKNYMPFARTLRNNMTKEEKHLWYDFLKGYSIQFVRQKVLGKYIADFYSARAKIIIELDGSQHFEEIGIEKDNERTLFLEKYGLQVLRITNYDINHNFESVCEYIDLQVKKALDK